MTFRFFSPWFLLLLLPLIVVFFIQLYRRPPALVVSSVAHFSGQKGSIRPKLGWFHLPLLFEIIGLICLTIALARPQQGREVIKDITEGIDIAICLDISGSMGYFDPAESASMNSIVDQINNGELKNRIDIAKAELTRFIDKRQTDRMSVIVFAGQPYQVCPLTFDKELLKKNVGEVDLRMLHEYGNGTGIASPLIAAVQRLKSSEAKRRVIILFTDGKHNRPQGLTPRQAAELAKEYNIIIHTIGIGSPNAVKILERGIFGGRRLVQADMQYDDVLMKDLAEKTDGRYFHVSNKEKFREVMDEIDQLEKVEIKRPRYVNYKDLFPIFLYSGIFLVGFSFLLGKSIFMRIP